MMDPRQHEEKLGTTIGSHFKRFTLNGYEWFVDLRKSERRVGEERRVNTKYVKRRLDTWGRIEAILLDKNCSIEQCINRDYEVQAKLIRIIAYDTGEPMTSPNGVPLFIQDRRSGTERRTL